MRDRPVGELGKLAAKNGHLKAHSRILVVEIKPTVRRGELNGSELHGASYCIQYQLAGLTQFFFFSYYPAIAPSLTAYLF